MTARAVVGLRPPNISSRAPAPRIGTATKYQNFRHRTVSEFDSTTGQALLVDTITRGAHGFCNESIEIV